MNASVMRAMTSSAPEATRPGQIPSPSQLARFGGGGVETKDAAVPEKRIREVRRIHFDRSRSDRADSTPTPMPVPASTMENLLVGLPEKS